MYFGANENDPLEPIHVHVSQGTPSAGATKIWITRSGKALLCNNSSKIPEKTLRNLLRAIEANSAHIIEEWEEHFGEIKYFI